MLHISSADRVGPLAGALAEVMAEPLPDPMTPEWVAIPTLGMHRWLALELARTLGASDSSSGDGVAANIEFAFPGALRHAVLDAHRAARIDGRSSDPWQIDRLVWAVLDVLHAHGDDPLLGPLTSLPAGATRFGRARRLADLFDRYAIHRPDLVVQWHSGHYVDAAGRALAPHDAWQPHLWRLTRARLGEPSPPERVPALLEALRAGALDLDLPPRLSVFGVTTLPGGESFLDLVAAVSAHRDVHVFLLDPSPAATARVREAALATPPQPDLLRADDRSDDAVLHPLLRSWGRPCRERTVLLTAAEKRGMPGPRVLDAPESGSSASATSLLARIQHDLRADTAPAGDFVLRPDDRSVQVYSCHGEARQVEALRDAILHLLADDPRLSEDDVVVLCPAIERFAPLVEAGFGSSVGSGDDAASGATPRLLYHVTDRSLRQAYPVVAALDALLELISGRCTVPEMLDFLSLAAVRERLGLDDDSLAAIGDWAVSANVRWGLDAEHRASWGLPPEHTANSWRAAVDRLLMGVAVSDDGIDLAPGGVAALGVEGDHIAAAGLLADAVMRLSAITADSKRARTAREWCGALTEWTEQLFAVDASQEWQFEKLRRMIADIGDLSIVDDEPSPVELTLADVRRLLADRLQGDPRRPDLFRGGITISSLTPLRWIPFRVVCLLGLDEAATASGSAGPDGDDLTATAPRLGDGDTRSEARQSLLEAVLAAGEHLVVTRTGHDVRNNREVPYGVAAAELRDVVVATLAPGSLGDYHRRIDTSVPRQPFDARCFTPGALGGPGAWSFDSDALEGARARAGGIRSPMAQDWPLLTEDWHDGRHIALDELRAFFRNPVNAYLRRRLRLRLPEEDATFTDALPIDLDPLAKWSVADRLIRARLAGNESQDWAAYERAIGTLPAGGLGDATAAAVSGTVEALLAHAEALGVELSRDDPVPIDLEIAGDHRIVGVIECRSAPPARGPATVTFSRPSPKQHLAAWLDLLCLVATDPETHWRSLVVRRKASGERIEALTLVVPGATPDERRARATGGLEVAVDIYRRGMCEPIPLFASLSPKLHQRSAKPGDWKGYQGAGDGYDAANEQVYGHLDLVGLTGIPARDDDPPGSGPGRAERFADYLWGAVAESAEPGR